MSLSEVGHRGQQHRNSLRVPVVCALVSIPLVHGVADRRIKRGRASGSTMPPREPAIYDGINASTGAPRFVDGEKIVKGNTPRMHSRIRTRINAAGKGDAGLGAAAGEIPWRTSRRLQEATFRLIQERDGGHTHSHVHMEGDSGNVSPLPARFLNRRHCPSQPKEEQNDMRQHIPAEVSVDGAQLEEMLPVVEVNSSLRVGPLRIRRGCNRRKKQYSDPVHLVRHDDSSKSGGFSSSSNTSSNADDIPSRKVETKAYSSVAAAVKEAEPAVGSGIAHIKQPQSCFDLLCSHIGFRGWRCYRYCITGQSFCIYHQTQNARIPGIR